MSRYIQGLERHSKADQIVSKFGATILAEVPKFSEVPKNMTLICVVQNALFDAALIVDSQMEYNMVIDSKARGDQRPTTWLILSKDKIEEL